MLDKSLFLRMYVQGHPYMESIRENRSLCYALLSTGAFIFLLALGWLPEIDEQFGIIEFEPEVDILLDQDI